MSPVLLRREIGRRLRAAREATGLTLVEAAPLLDIGVSSLSRYETGQGVVTVHLIRSMMDVYHQRMDDLVDLVREARRKGWWKQYGISDGDFIALETGATTISNYEVTFVPGLLQTADYARTLFESRRARAPEWVDNQLAVRLIRQERLTDEEEPLRLDAVLHEFTLRHPVGGPAVMRAQLGHLALVTELPTVTLRVLPAKVMSWEAMRGGFTVLDFASAGQPSIVHLQHALGNERQDRAELVDAGKLRFDYLRSLALDPDESVALIEWAADAWWPNEK